MNSNRMEAFSDGVLAVIITIMVLELKAPHHASSFLSLKPLLPIFMSYLLSFIFIGIYWNNHHHLLQSIEKVNGKILWANLHLLFWLSLVPFFTSCMGENHFMNWSVALYGTDLLGAAIAYHILTKVLITHHGDDSLLSKAYGYGKKEIASTMLYIIAIPVAFIYSFFSYAIYITVAIMWLIPDRRIENCIEKVAATAE